MLWRCAELKRSGVWCRWQKCFISKKLEPQESQRQASTEHSHADGGSVSPNKLKIQDGEADSESAGKVFLECAEEDAMANQKTPGHGHGDSAQESGNAVEALAVEESHRLAKSSVASNHLSDGPSMSETRPPTASATQCGHVDNRMQAKESHPLANLDTPLLTAPATQCSHVQTEEPCRCEASEMDHSLLIVRVLSGEVIFEIPKSKFPWLRKLPLKSHVCQLAGKKTDACQLIAGYVDIQEWERVEDIIEHD